MCKLLVLRIMRLLFLTYQGGIAGSTYSISYLARGLSQQGHEVFVGCPEDSFLYNLLDDTEVKCIPMTFRSKTDGACIRHIAEIVSDHHIDIINTQSSKDRYLAMFAKMRYHLQSEIVHTRRQMCKSFGGPVAWLTYLTSKAIIAVSQEVKHSLIRKGFFRKQIKVITNGTPASKYDHIDPVLVEKLRRKYKIHPGDIVLGVVSRLKDQEQLIRALPYLPFSVKVIFVGITREQLARDQEVENAGHELIFTGKIGPEEALAHYKLFTIKVLPSRMEGLSQSLLEAMYLNVPVIATAEGGNLSLIEHGVNGLLFEHSHPLALANEIERLVNKPGLRHKLALNAKEMVQHEYSMENTVKNYEWYFEELLEVSHHAVKPDFHLQ